MANHVSPSFNSELLLGKTWGFPEEPVEHIETHAAHVFLCGDRAFKIKKSIKLPYLDFSTIERRRQVLADELTINKSFAPDIYLHVGETLGEPVLVMKRFPAHALLSWHLIHQGIDDALAANLASEIALAHDKSVRSNASGSGIMAALGRQLMDAFTSSPDVFPTALVQEFVRIQQQTLRRVKPMLDERGNEGLVRRCHGDIHCANIIVLDGRPVLFDAIEFSEKIATIDVLYDLSFLIMDLLRYDQRRAANTVFNRYFHLRRAEEDLSGLEALPLFLSTRAGVRALVTADLAHELPTVDFEPQCNLARGYFNSAIAFLKPATCRLVCIGGLSGTGKSTLAKNLASSLGPPPGAIHVRSDVERKVLAGVAETQRLDTGWYSPSSSTRVYAVILARARKALEAGHSAIVDAVFANGAERDPAESLAKKLGVEFKGIWLEAKTDVKKLRVSNRVGDASDASPDVVDAQLRYQLGDIRWGHIDASGDQASVCNRAIALLQ